MNALFSLVVSSLRPFRAAAVFTLLMPALVGLAAAQAPAGAPAAAPAGVGAGAITGTAPAQTAPAGAPPATQGATAANAAGQGAGQQAGEAANLTGQSVGTPAYTQEQLTDFQQLAASSTGRSLPIFGASLFNGVPSTFAPVTDVPVAPDYVLGPGDDLIIQLSGQISQQYDLRIDRTGIINVPVLGPVHLAGIPYGALQAYLHDQFARIYRNFSVNANLGSLRTIQVFVVGEARAPGSYSISSLSTLLNAIFASGGPLPSGSLRDIQVKRNGTTLVHFDLYDLLLKGDKTNDLRLNSGDVIFIPFAGVQVAVAGSVKTPGIYELKGPTSVNDALALAGGATAIAGGGAARLERIFEHSQRSVEDVNLAFGGTQLLQNGDILSVSSIVERFHNAVTLRGNVANPGRYVWRPGLRVSDLIPNKESLITRNYWNRQNQLGQLAVDYQPNGPGSAGASPGALQVRGTADQLAQAAQLQAQARTRGTGSSNAPASGAGTGIGSVAGSDAGITAGTATPTQGTDQNSMANGTGGASQGGTDGTPTPRNVSNTQAGGSSVGSALTASNNPFRAQNDVILSAPDIDWSYAVIERLSTVDLKTSLIPFNLGKLVLNGDASQNYELQPNDVVTIFSTADIRVPTAQQTRYVRLEGEFVAPGVYSVVPGETLRSLLQRAGGFTPDAYLYASEFTRESTRRVEAQRLQEYADQLEAEISSVTANNTARAVSSSDQQAAAASATDARQAVSRLRRVVPSGRIVLELKPNSVGIQQVPDLALEDGDRFVIPRVPSSITVQGQVYNANAFVYTANRRMRDYLQRAGGPNREADKKREFILRADGSVISNQYADVRRAPVFPGDTLVVPPVIDRRGVFQKIVDLAGIVSGFGYSATTLYLIGRGY